MGTFLKPLGQGVLMLRRHMKDLSGNDVNELNQQVWGAFNWKQFDGMRPNDVPRAGIELPEGYRLLNYRGQGFALVDSRGVPHMIHDAVLSAEILTKRLEYEMKNPQWEAPGQIPGK